MRDVNDDLTSSNRAAKTRARSRSRVPESSRSKPQPPISLSSRRSEPHPISSPQPESRSARSRGSEPSRRARTRVPEASRPERSQREDKVSQRHEPFSTRNRAQRARSTSDASGTRERARRLEVVPPPEVLARPKSARIESPRSQSRSALALLYGARLLILGIGIGVIAGTALSIWDPASRSTVGALVEKPEPVAASPTPAIPSLELSQEILPLKTQIQTAIAAQSQLLPGLMIVDADSHAYLDLNGSTTFSAASTIKFPILVAFFQDVDAGKIRLDEPLTMRKELIATESGELQNLPPGSQFPAIEVATKMITISDNTATNMIIDRLGGKEAVTQRFQSWGLTNTALRNPLPDLSGTNTSSPRDMVTLLGLVNSGKLVSMRSHDRLLDIMRKVANNSLIPQGLGQGAIIAHKTGDIGTLLGDVGLVDLPNGRRYFIAALVKRPHNDDRAYDLIRQVSQISYRYFNQAASTSAPSPSQGAEPLKTKIAQP